MASVVLTILAVIGGLWLASYLFSLARVVYVTKLRSSIDLKATYGSWVVITGCTDGIGKAMALELARRGHSLFLIGRNEEKLKSLQTEVSDIAPSVQTKFTVIDFQKGFGAADGAKLTSALKGLEVGVLVNNVGVSYPFPQWFHELSDDELRSIVTINIDSVNWMTRAVLPIMLERSKGCVINVASAAARAPNPLLAAYGASKNYVESLTASLSVEYAGKGICFQSHAPLVRLARPHALSHIHVSHSLAAARVGSVRATPHTRCEVPAHRASSVRVIIHLLLAGG